MASTRRHSAWISVALFYLPPVVLIISFLGLYLSSVQWDASAKQLSALLYLAKVHESLIIISLSSILYHRLRYGMLHSGGGVAYRFVTAPFQVNNPLHLASKASAGRRGRRVGAGLVVACLVLAILTAPSANVVMLPRLDRLAGPRFLSRSLRPCISCGQIAELVSNHGTVGGLGVVDHDAVSDGPAGECLGGSVCNETTSNSTTPPGQKHRILDKIITIPADLLNHPTPFRLRSGTLETHAVLPWAFSQCRETDAFGDISTVWAGIPACVPAMTNLIFDGYAPLATIG